MKKENLTYAAAQQELQSLVEALQGEMISMDDLSAKVQRAAELIQWCRDHLRKTESELDQTLS